MNKLQKKLSEAGYKFAKKKWPMLQVEDLRRIGITPEELSRETHSATIHETMGPHWKYGFFLGHRPKAFNK